MSLEHVLEQIRSGAIRSKVDYGFVLIDVAPASPVLAPPASRLENPEPVEWSPSALLTDEELALLNPVGTTLGSHSETGFASANAVFSPNPIEPTSDELAWLGEAPALPAAEVPVFVEPPAFAPESAYAMDPVFSIEPTGAAEPANVGAPVESMQVESLPVEFHSPAMSTPVDAESDAPRSRRRRRPGRKLPAAPTLEILVVPETVVEEDEAGPDPNFGVVEDDRPLNWRQARQRAAATRRRPPPVRMAG